MYEKQHFVKGQILTAEHLNHIEDGIYNATGKSAYEVAVDNGFTGTEAEWLESLGAVKNIQVSTDDLQAGVTALDTGTLYVVYE